MNKKAQRKLKRLVRRYDCKDQFPRLHEVEKTLWKVNAIANRRGGGYWFKNRAPLIEIPLEQWTSVNIGWSFPCIEALRLIRRCLNRPFHRIIDVGAGFGLWTRVLEREFGAAKVIGLDPNSNSSLVIRTTLGDWCNKTGGPTSDDILFASWLPCENQEGDTLGLQILDKVSACQPFIYVGSGPRGPTGTTDFYDRLAVEFVEVASEPMPRVDESDFPRDFLRIYNQKRDN